MIQTPINPESNVKCAILTQLDALVNLRLTAMSKAMAISATA
jgi:hypothetical protein